jgi:hypothetical protein
MSEIQESGFLPKKVSRMGITTRINSESKLHKPTIEGLENLINIPKNEKMVIATTHLSDIDMETAIATIAPYRDLSVASQSTHLENPVFGTIMRWATKNEIYGISSKFVDKKARLPDYRFDPKDFEAMKGALDKGRTMVIAAHQPAYEWKLPDKPGLGAVYLAQISGATILPTTVDVQSPEFIDLRPITSGAAKRLLLGKRPNVRVAFGKPIHLAPIASANLANTARFLSHDGRHTMTKDETESAIATLKIIRAQGAQVMESLAKMLPPNKKGIWENTPQE